MKLTAEAVSKERMRAERECDVLASTPKDFALYLTAHQNLALWVIAEQLQSALERNT